MEFSNLVKCFSVKSTREKNLVRGVYKSFFSSLYSNNVPFLLFFLSGVAGKKFFHFLLCSQIERKKKEKRTSHTKKEIYSSYSETRYQLSHLIKFTRFNQGLAGKGLAGAIIIGRSNFGTENFDKAKVLLLGSELWNNPYSLLRQSLLGQSLLGQPLLVQSLVEQ